MFPGYFSQSPPPKLSKILYQYFTEGLEDDIDSYTCQ